eukprot:5120358-Amphidinium_carterae.1
MVSRMTPTMRNLCRVYPHQSSFVPAPASAPARMFASLPVVPPVLPYQGSQSGSQHAPTETPGHPQTEPSRRGHQRLSNINT